MKQFKDVRIYHTGFEEFYDGEGYTGSILINDDHTFEGVVNAFYHEDRQFVFGILQDGSIRLYRSTKGDKELPKVYRGKREGKTRFDGGMSATTQFAECPLGECTLYVVEADSYRDFEYQYETAMLEEKIASYREELGEESKALYEEVFYQRLHSQKKKNTQNQ